MRIHDPSGHDSQQTDSTLSIVDGNAKSATNCDRVEFLQWLLERNDEWHGRLLRRLLRRVFELELVAEHALRCSLPIE